MLIIRYEKIYYQDKTLVLVRTSKNMYSIFIKYVF